MDNDPGRQDDVLDQILKTYFTLSRSALREAPGVEQRRTESVEYFRQELARQVEQCAGNSALVVSLFHSTLGFVLTTGTLPQDEARQQIVDYLQSLYHDGGFLSVSGSAPAGHLLSQALPPDIYSTEYALRALELIGAGVHEEVLNEITTWIKKQRAPSGWYYQRSLADTMESRKLQNEYTLQTFLALTVLSRYGALDPSLPEQQETRNILIASVPAMRYVGTLLYVLKSLKILGMGSDEEKGEVQKSSMTFLARHYDDASGGFFEYRFENVKIDEFAGQMQRFQSDYLTPTITASYHALEMLRLFADDAAVRDWWRGHKDQVRTFFEGFQPSAEGGFGSHLQIARLTAPFGPDVSPLETLMVICAPGLVESIPI